MIFKLRPHDELLIEIYTINTKLPMFSLLASKVFTPAKKLPPGGAQPDNHWFKSQISANLATIPILTTEALLGENKKFQ